MEIGETRQLSVWYNGNEQLSKAEKLIRHIFKSEEEEYNIKYSPVELKVSDSVPPTLDPPEADAQILLGEALVIDTGFTRIETNHLLKQLSRSDLKRLRAKTKHAWKKQYPDAPELPTTECDHQIAYALFNHLSKQVQ